LRGRIRAGEGNRGWGQPWHNQAGLWGQGWAQDFSPWVMSVSAGSVAGQGPVVVDLEINILWCHGVRTEGPRWADTGSGTTAPGQGCSGPLRHMNALRTLTFSVLTAY